jgi:hypothetical protein
MKKNESGSGRVIIEVEIKNQSTQQINKKGETAFNNKIIKKY